jgi:hypothetical protein
MRQEHVTLQDVDISQLYDEMKKYLKNLALNNYILELQLGWHLHPLFSI